MPNQLQLNELDHNNIKNISDLKQILKAFNCKSILIKKLGKNNNDKNQIYIHPNPDYLNGIFDLDFERRGISTSRKKKGTQEEIPAGIFNKFHWIDTDLKKHKVTECKAILYAQYPEVRLSGFQTIENTIPTSLSIKFTKSNPQVDRFLAIGADRDGAAYAILIVNPKTDFQKEFEVLKYHKGSKACKLIELTTDLSPSERLKNILARKIAGKDVKGCRLKNGVTIPFTGTQVHGYTLEHELGISTNAAKDGDYLGIELKCFTSNKLTLFTPEPDGGLYAEDFKLFMKTYGYEKEAMYRFTGLHRTGKVSESTGLNLRVLHSAKKGDASIVHDFDINKPFKDQLKNLRVVLLDSNDKVAASWSLSRLFGSWGVKHNEVVYVPATVQTNKIAEEIKEGYLKRVYFSDSVLWCKESSVEKMIHAIVNGTIFLDPAPKHNPNNPKDDKRRSQWRVNNIYRDAKQLYKNVDEVKLK